MIYKNSSAKMFALAFDSLCPRWLSDSGFMSDIYDDLLDAESDDEVSDIVLNFQSRLRILSEEISQFYSDVKSDRRAWEDQR